MSQELSRRAFMKAAALGAAGLTAAGVVSSCTSATGEEGSSGDSATQTGEGTAAPETKGSGATTQITDTLYSTASWRIRPDEVSEFSEEYDADVCVCGHGYAGITACRELASQGYKVVLMEKKAEETYMAVGNASGTLGGTYIEKRGYDRADPIEFFQNWMLITGNVANQPLIMKFCQNCADNIDWYYGLATTEELDTMADYYRDQDMVGNHRIKEMGGLKFWNAAYSMYVECSQTVMQGYQREDAIAKGAEVLFGTEAWDTIQDSSGSVAGVVGLKEDGSYIKVNCKACVLASGGFAGNEEMMYDLMVDMATSLVEGETMSGMQDSDGRGMQMASWAGAHMETWPIPGMNFKHYSPSMSVQSTQPQALWLDGDCKRFCNEYYPVIEHRGRSTLFMPRKPYYVVFDDNFDDYATYFIPQHGAFNPNEQNVADLRAQMDDAYALLKGEGNQTDETDEAAIAGAAEGGEGGGEGGPQQASVELVCGETVEELATNLGLTGEQKETFIAQVARYNEMCAAGRDDDFGRYTEVLFPVNQGPFYAVVSESSFGSTMVTMGGVLTDGEQNVVDVNYEPIPGLYATGNVCGRRYGDEYTTPIFGISLSMVIVLGRECGKSVAGWLDDEVAAGTYQKIGA